MDIKFVKKDNMTLKETSEVLNGLDCAVMFLHPQPRLATIINNDLSDESLKKIAKQLAWKSHDPNVYVPLLPFISESNAGLKEREE